MQNSHDKPTLKIHEWLAVMLIIGLLAFLTAISWVNQKYPSTIETGAPHFIASQELDITVQGAVEHPGRHIVKKGTTVREALALVGVLPEADLRRLKLDAKVRRNQVIKVPKMAMITVMLEGAVAQPGPVLVPRGSQLMDLIDKVALQETADVDKLRKKRRLKDGEIIVVPTKIKH
jgi:hypothetical protein